MLCVLCGRAADAGQLPGPADVTVHAEPDTLLAGERLHVEVVVHHDGSRPVSVEGLETGPGRSFEMVRRNQSTVRLPDGSVELRVSTDLAAFGSGRQRLPGFTVTTGQAGRSKGSRFTFRPASSVVVASLTDSTLTRLRPSAPPVGPGFLPWLLLLPAVAVVGLLLFAVLHLLRMTLLKDSKVGFTDPSRSARQKLKSLDRQLSKGLPPDEGYEALSNILREFLQHRYRFRALEQVTQEIADELESREVKARETVLKLLLRADFIKFADGRPDIDECRSSLKIAEVFCSGATEQLESSAPIQVESRTSADDGPTR